VQESRQLDLDTHRDAGGLIATTLLLFARHALLFLSVTLLVVAPVTVLVTGVWGGRIEGGGAADISTGPLVATLCWSPLVSGFSELVDGRWWRTAGTLLLGWVMLTIVSYPAGRAVDAINSGIVYIALYTLLQVLTLSLTALFGTLMYFSLRAEKEHPFGAAPVRTYLPPVSPTPAAQPPADL
jgi:uncharacterized membrane protein